jgi:Bacteriocin-protection, YdeI or OmpD-Associated/Domain of unknown function (DUF1905)
MSKDPRPNSAGPAVLRFKARLVRDPATTKNGSETLLNVPKVISERLRGVTKVEGVMNGQPFRASLETSTSGGHSLRVNKAMLRGAGAGVGDTVKLAILGPEPKLTVPADLRDALNASDKATSLWKDLAPLGRRDYVRWIESAKTAGTRARRITRTVEQLAEGKRRPCCVNVYEFMLSRVDEE